MTSYIDSRRIWGIFVNLAGASDTDSDWVQFRQWFDKALADDRGTDEYRFMGSLGFGGKFWLGRNGMHVNCYREHETPERLETIERTNHALATVWCWQS